MTISPTLYNSRSEEWPTPHWFFDTPDQEFCFWSRSIGRRSSISYGAP